MVKAMKMLDMMIVIDPYPSATAAMAAMPVDGVQEKAGRGVYLLPAATPVSKPRIVHGFQPLPPVAREGDRSAVRVALRPGDHARLRQEARLRE